MSYIPLANQWYLPHHAVFHPHKPSKLRIVFHCATQFKGTSLNDQLLHGPDLMNSLFGILERFRQDSDSLVSNIGATLYQMKVDPKAAEASRFLWCPDLSKQHVEYRHIKVHLYECISLLSCAKFCLKRTAKSNSGTSHEVIDILNNFCVDDCFKSAFFLCCHHLKRWTLWSAPTWCLLIYQVVMQCLRRPGNHSRGW